MRKRMGGMVAGDKGLGEAANANGRVRQHLYIGDESWLIFPNYGYGSPYLESTRWGQVGRGMHLTTCGINNSVWVTEFGQWDAIV
jgi:hypothetical protein